MSKEYVGITKGFNYDDCGRQIPDQSGEKNPFYGKTHSKESIDSMSESSKGQRNGMLGKHHTEISKNLIREKNSRPKTLEQRKRMSESATGNVTMISPSGETKRIALSKKLEYISYGWVTLSSKQKRIKCQYCDVVSTVGNIKRWHNENCKHRKMNNDS